METLIEKPVKVTIWNRNFICILLSNTFLGLSMTSTNTIVSSYAKFLGAQTVLIGALTGLFYGVSLSVRPVTGPLISRLDKRKLLISAFILGLTANIGYALTGSVRLFILFRILNGIYISIAGPLSITIASDTLPKEKLGTGIGYYGLAGVVTAAIGPSIGIALTEYGNSRINAGFGYMLVFLFSALSMIMSLIFCYFLKIPGRSKTESAVTGVWYKNIISLPSIPPAIIMALICMGNVLNNTYMYAYAQVKGIAGIGIFFTVFAAVMLITRPLSGRIVDKYGVNGPVFAGVSLFAVSFIIMGFSRSMSTLLLAAVVGAAGYGTAFPAVQTLCIQTVPPAKRALASNTLFSGMDLGSFLGPLTGSVIYSFVGDYSKMFLLMAIPVGFALVVFAVFRKNGEKLAGTDEAAAVNGVADDK